MKRLNNLTLLAPLVLAPLLSAQALDDLTSHNVKLESVTYLGKRAIKVVEDGDVPSGEAYAIVKGTAFQWRYRTRTGGASRSRSVFRRTGLCWYRFSAAKQAV